MLLPQDLFDVLPSEAVEHQASFVFRWAAKKGNSDLTMRMHALRWNAEDAAAYVTRLNDKFGEWAAFFWEKGELHLQFSTSFWANLLSQLHLPGQAWLHLGKEDIGGLEFDPMPELLALANILANEQEWEQPLDASLVLKKETWELLQALLFFGTLQADGQGRRQYWLNWLRKLWNHPILFSAEPLDSFCRLQMLRHWLGLLKTSAAEIVE